MTEVLLGYTYEYFPYNFRSTLFPNARLKGLTGQDEVVNMGGPKESITSPGVTSETDSTSPLVSFRDTGQ